MPEARVHWRPIVAIDPALTARYAGRQVLVTGGLGFLGSNLVPWLLGAGAAVRVLDHSWPGAATGPLHDQLDLVKADTRDAAAVRRAVAGCATVFNLAGRSGPAASNASPLDDLDVNLRGHLTLLEACRESAPGAKVVFPSSRLVYAPTDRLPVGEDARTEPKSIYGIHKLTCEHYHLLYGRLHELRTTVLRITNPYGPHQRREQSRYGIINLFIQRAVQGLDLTVYGDGAQLRDYVHVDDVVRALLLAGAGPESDGAVLNVGGAHPVTFREMAELVVSCAGRGAVRSVPWPPEVAEVETGSFVADISRIRQVLGWSPQVDLETGIREVVRGYTG